MNRACAGSRTRRAGRRVVIEVCAHCAEKRRQTEPPHRQRTYRQQVRPGDSVSGLVAVRVEQPTGVVARQIARDEIGGTRQGVRVRETAPGDRIEPPVDVGCGSGG